jgi:uncharacterized protein DUF6320
MKLCHNCGVEIEDQIARCPLCGASLLDDGSDGESGPCSDSDPDGDSAESAEFHAAERRGARFWLWEMFTIVIIATAIIVAATDFGYGFDLSWSIFPLTALAFIWIVVTSVIVLGKDILFLYVATTIAVLAYLFVLDTLVAGDAWFVPFALPMTLLVAVVGGGAAATVRNLKLSLFQTLAVSVIFVGIFVIGLEVILYFALELESILSWSIVAFGGCLSIALLLWIINKRLRERHADFKRVFHL